MPVKNPSKLRKWSSALIGLLVFSAGIAFVYITDANTIESPDELTEIEGTFHSILIVKSSRGSSISFDLKLNEYNNVFKIAADYAGIFDQARFYRDIPVGTELNLMVRKADISDLNAADQVKIFGLKERRKHYLDPKEVLNKDAKSRSSAPYILGLFALLAIGIYIYRRYYHHADL